MALLARVCSVRSSLAVSAARPQRGKRPRCVKSLRERYESACVVLCGVTSGSRASLPYSAQPELSGQSLPADAWEQACTVAPNGRTTPFPNSHAQSLVDVSSRLLPCCSPYMLQNPHAANATTIVPTCTTGASHMQEAPRVRTSRPAHHCRPAARSQERAPAVRAATEAVAQLAGLPQQLLLADGPRPRVQIAVAVERAPWVRARPRRRGRRGRRRRRRGRNCAAAGRRSRQALLLLRALLVRLHARHRVRVRLSRARAPCALPACAAPPTMVIQARCSHTLLQPSRHTWCAALLCEHQQGTQPPLPRHAP